MKWGFDFCTSVWGGGIVLTNCWLLLLTPDHFTNCWLFLPTLVTFWSLQCQGYIKQRGSGKLKGPILKRPSITDFKQIVVSVKQQPNIKSQQWHYRYMSKDLFLLISLYFLIQVILARYYNFKWQLITYLY